MGATLLTVTEYLLLLGLVVLLIPTTLLFLQVLAAKRVREAREPMPTRQHRIAVLIPAHNESAGIVATLNSVRAQLRAGDRLLVVADNCEDDTAKVAAASGAEVVERRDGQHRGKGYALDFGVRSLEADPPEVLVVVDADCTLGAHCLDHLTQACMKTLHPVQALNLMHSQPGAGPKARLGELAWRVRNQVRPLGALRLGLPCQLMGTGMAFPWETIHSAPLASGHIAEDLLLGLDLAERDKPPLFCPQACVSSVFPDAANLRTQHTRWEQGHLKVIASHAPPLLWRAFIGGRPRLGALALDLCVPPLTVLALLLLLGLLAAVVLAWWGGGVASLWLAGLANVMLAWAFLLAWWRFGRKTVCAAELLAVPGYLLAKLPIYGKLLMGHSAQWVRTKRDDVGH